MRRRRQQKTDGRDRIYPSGRWLRSARVLPVRGSVLRCRLWRADIHRGYRLAAQRRILFRLSGGAAEAEWTDNAGRLPHRKSVFFVVLPGSCAGVRGSFPGGRRAGRSGRGRRFLLRGSETVGYRFPAQYSAFSFPVRSARCGGLWD